MVIRVVEIDSLWGRVPSWFLGTLSDQLHDWCPDLVLEWIDLIDLHASLLALEVHLVRVVDIDGTSRLCFTGPLVDILWRDQVW